MVLFPLLPIALCLMCLSTYGQSDPTYTYKFTNKTGGRVDDIGINLVQPVPPTAIGNPFSSIGVPNGNAPPQPNYELYGGLANGGAAVADGKSINVSITVPNALNSPIASWFWTIGGALNGSGQITNFWQSAMFKPAAAKVTALSGSATGNGVINLWENGALYAFDTTAGFTVAQTMSAFNTFVAGIVDGTGFSLVGNYSIDSTDTTVWSNVQGDPSLDISVSVANPDSTQTLLIQAVPEPSAFALLGLGTLSLLAYSWRRRTAKV